MSIETNFSKNCPEDFIANVLITETLNWKVSFALSFIGYEVLQYRGCLKYFVIQSIWYLIKGGSTELGKSEYLKHLATFGWILSPASVHTEPIYGQWQLRTFFFWGGYRITLPFRQPQNTASISRLFTMDVT